MLEEKEENKTIDHSANSDRQNTVDKTTDILGLSPTIGQNIAAFLEAKAFMGLQFSAVNRELPPFSDRAYAQSEVLSVDFDYFKCNNEEV